MIFQQILEENRGWQKLGALLHNVTLQLARNLDMLYIVEFYLDLTISNGDQYVYLEHVFR